jgi:hypothetical protein
MADNDEEDPMTPTARPAIGSTITLTCGLTVQVTGHYPKYPWLFAVKDAAGRKATAGIDEIA